ncbi:hypothetical protein HHL19_11280 [Streptomyces sp. R302]|uniref:hypothetical protein n=1 Tax=unclassified Streptomyces TaxID=2593676 RepID=UPI00145EAD8B|nr:MULTISPECIES: hypothetical protein [unclassified Streptomyces]NML50245.1 hypothetical protein [Streptomyces sp. R301]NML79236.1 hypothetical protein [Streptomyces sp. R302]
MKIRRMLATAVAAAVTTPVVLLAAGPAFAETPKPAAPTGAAAQEAGQDDPDGPDFKELERLEAAFAAAEQKVEDLTADRERLKNDLRAGNLDKKVLEELAAAEEAAADAAAAKTAAEATLTAAKEALAAIEADATATPEQKTAAAEAVTTAETGVTEAVAAVTAADERLARATTARDSARVALAQKITLLALDIEAAEQELADAEAALDAYWEGQGEFRECVVDRSVVSTFTGPKSITVGSSADFSLTVKNASDRDLDEVRAVVSAIRLPESWEDIDEEHPNLDKYISVEWKLAADAKWNKLTSQDVALELGPIAEGAAADIALRVTVDAAAPAGEGVVSANTEYANDDESCGVSRQIAKADFDLVEPTKTPTTAPTATPSPSASTAAPAPAPTSNTPVQQGGTRGQLAATGSNDTLPQLGAAAGAALVLGAGAVFVARRRKADA